MSDTNFIEGPWKVTHITDGLRIDSEHCDGIAYIDIYGAEQAALVEADATARLIAAAPELYSIAKRIPDLVAARLAAQDARQAGLRASFDGDSKFEDRCDEAQAKNEKLARTIEDEIMAVVAKVEATTAIAR